MYPLFTVSGYYAVSERDNYENGCYGIAFADDNPSYKQTGKTLKELFSKLEQDFGNNDFLLDSCEELGRLDLQCLQRQRLVENKPSEATMKDWKEGKIDLWLTNYTFHVKVVTEGISLTELQAKED